MRLKVVSLFGSKVNNIYMIGCNHTNTNASYHIKTSQLNVLIVIFISDMGESFYCYICMNSSQSCKCVLKS